MPLHFGRFKALVVEPVTLIPGASKVLVDLQAHSNFSTLKIIALGVSEHPRTSYTYNVDGVSFTLPIPLGEFQAPVYTCRDLGQYIEAQNNFTITVKNEGTETLLLAAYVLYDQPREG